MRWSSRFSVLPEQPEGSNFPHRHTDDEVAVAGVVLHFFSKAVATASLIFLPRRSVAMILPSGPTSMIWGMAWTP